VEPARLAGKVRYVAVGVGPKGAGAVRRALVTGAGGFVGHHLVASLTARGDAVIGVDLRPPEFAPTAADRFVIHDIRQDTPALRALFEGVDDVYALAADMGGMGFISKNHATITRNNTAITLHTLEAARLAGVKRYFFTSSGCVYPRHLQAEPAVVPLEEPRAITADPEDGYGWEKLYAEKLCGYYREEHGLGVRIARLHNVYGPLGAYRGGREKAPAAICRKVALSIEEGLTAIEIWGDGKQTRSFCYVDDCIRGIHLLMDSGYEAPLNLGRDELVSIDDLADMVMRIAGVRLDKVHRRGPQGVRGRNSDNTRARRVLGWAPEVDLETGIRATYPWVRDQVREARRRGEAL
jgi:nucleoside-diphosphate-sugar epimerase